LLLRGDCVYAHMGSQRNDKVFGAVALHSVCLR
jgi:hypothetical protein